MSKKLTDQQKIEIVEKYKTGDYNCAELGREYGITRHNINQLLRRRNIPIYNNRSELNRRYSINENCFDIIDTEESAYWLGFLYADGYNNEEKGIITLSLGEEDKLIIEKFRKFVNSNKPIFIKKPQFNNYQNMCGLDVFSKHMSQQLTHFGCFQRKSLTVKFPTEEQVPSHLIRHFLRGYFDGNGSISYGFFGEKLSLKTNCNITSSIYFCEMAIKSIFEKTELKFTISKPTIYRNFNIRAISLGGNRQCELFLSWIYDNSTIYLDRKYNKYINLKDINLSR